MADTINDSLLLVGNKLSKRPPDVKHPFGYGSEVYFYSHTVTLVIFHPHRARRRGGLGL